MDFVTDKMNFIYSAVLLLVLFNAKKSDECDNETIVAKAGSNISLTWILPDTRSHISFSIGRQFEKRIATRLADQNCEVWDNSSMHCNVNSTDDRLIVVLHIFNVATRQSGNYTLWKKTQLLDQSSYTYKHLVVIGKPNIMEAQKPIFGQPFKLTCNTSNEQNDYLYRWIINDAERTTGYHEHSHIISNLSMNDNFSNVTCQVCLNETERNLTCITCKNYICSMDSDPYTIQVLYGPDNVSLSREERYFKLKDHENFEIVCSAFCYPNCTFWWKGRDTIQSQKLNMFFEPKLAGQYSCHVTNEQTNITVISDPITLHLAKKDKELQDGNIQDKELQDGNIQDKELQDGNIQDKELQDGNMEVPLSSGLVGVAVFLVIIGLLLVRQWRTTPSDKLDSQVLADLVVNLQTFTNGEISKGISRIQNRPLPIPNTHNLSSRRRYSPRYLNQNRRSRSLHNIMDSTQDSFNPLRHGLSVQGLYYSSNLLETSLKNGTQAKPPIKWRHLSICEESQLDDMSSLENGNNLEFLHAKVLKDGETMRDERTAEEESETLNNLQQFTFKEEPQENLYNIID